MVGRHETRAALVAALALTLGLGVTALAKDGHVSRLSGVINDFTAAHDAKGGTSGPWDIRGVWQLQIDRRGQANFTAALTMENSDYWLLINPNPPANPDAPASRSPHTHHVRMSDAQVTDDPAYVASHCPTAGYKPPTTTGFVAEGLASVTGNGGFAPFAPTGQLSPLTVCVTGGSQVEYSNVTLVFGTPASGHFGTQPINGAVRTRE